MTIAYPPYDPAFAKAIAGYPEAVTVVHRRKLWRSLVDNNLSEPGGDNLDWREDSAE